MDGSKEKGKEGRTAGLTNSYINRQKDAWMNGGKDRQKEGWMDG